MAPGVYSAISEYLDRMHDEIIWPSLAGKKAKKSTSNASGPVLPTPALRPDRLVSFQRVLMNMHAKSVILFQPAPSRCMTNDDCGENEECRDGVCVPRWAPNVMSSGKPCTSPDDCDDQKEDCVAGVCTPRMGALDFGAVSQVPDYSSSNELKQALSAYYEKIAGRLVGGLATHPNRIAAVREILVQGCADCCKVAGIGLPCDSVGCPDAWTCVNGICVPIPFRLVFRQL